MGDYLAPMAFLAVAFVLFALVHRNRRDSCADCTGECEKSRCEKNF